MPVRGLAACSPSLSGLEQAAGETPGSWVQQDLSKPYGISLLLKKFLPSFLKHWQPLEGAEGLQAQI